MRTNSTSRGPHGPIWRLATGRTACVGAALARLEAHVALSAFFTRFPRIRLAPEGEFPRTQTWIAKGTARCPVFL